MKHLLTKGHFFSNNNTNIASSEGTTWKGKTTDRGQWKAWKEGFIQQWVDKA